MFTEHVTGRLQVLLGAALISFSPIFVKLSAVPPGISGFYRTFFGGTILLVIVLARRQSFRAGPRTYLAIAACGLTFALDLRVWHSSIGYLGPGLATLLGNFQVFFLTLYGVLFLRERPRLRFLAAAPLGLAGIALLAGIDPSRLDPSARVGFLLGLGTAFAYSLYIVLLRVTRTTERSLSPLANICVISLTSAFLLGAGELARGEDFGIPNGTSWFALVSYGVFGQVLGWVLISRGLPRVRSSFAGLLLLLQPTLAYVWEILIFSKRMTWMEFWGAVIAVSAIYLGSTSRAARGGLRTAVADRANGEPPQQPRPSKSHSPFRSR
jgi:drug/metabolite transporter (DMT)-like permease